ncbi:MAG: hypothetical protein EOM40_15850 [Clostridia bacterium]|nr:hypothetical protein [Clostridia bacterium]
MDNNRCSLCEGRIVNGRCVECGMTYRPAQGRYFLNERRPDQARIVLNEDRIPDREDGTQAGYRRTSERGQTANQKARAAQEKSLNRSMNQSSSQNMRQDTRANTRANMGSNVRPNVRSNVRTNVSDSFSQGMGPNGTGSGNPQRNYTNLNGRRMSAGNIFQRASAWGGNGRKTAQWVGVLIVILIAVIGALVENFEANKESSYEETYDTSYDVDTTLDVGRIDDTSPLFDDIEEAEEMDIYGFVTEEMPEEGDTLETTMEAGRYVVGQQIPAGTYRMSGTDLVGMYVNLDDEENNIYHTWWFNEYETASNEYEIEDVRLYTGAVLTIQGTGDVLLDTENAQGDELQEPESNPLVEEVTVTMDAMVAGKDFEPGTYDAEVLNGEGNLCVEDEDGYYYSYYLDAEGIYNASSFRNLEILEGDTVYYEKYLEDEDCDIVLKPSAEIWN